MGALVLGASLLVGSSYLTLAHEMEEVFEDNLKQVALAVANHHGTYGMARTPSLAEQLPQVYDEYGKFEFVTAAWTRNGTLLHRSDPAVNLPFLSRSGLSVVSVGQERWHLYTIVLQDGIVQAAQRDSERQALARETGAVLIAPALLLLAVLAVMLTLALRRGLAPLALAADQVTARSVEALHPIALSAHPSELHLLIGAINDLMYRLGGALSLQRLFLADAAHELRTPITALRLQLQLLERAGDAVQRQAAQNQLRAGIKRAQHLVEQLLQLSRLAPETPALHRESVDLAELVRAAVGRFSARADQRKIDLGAVTDGNPVTEADAQQLTILLNNLVDNALQHTPVGGRIDVATPVCASPTVARASHPPNGSGSLTASTAVTATVRVAAWRTAVVWGWRLSGRLPSVMAHRLYWRTRQAAPACVSACSLRLADFGQRRRATRCIQVQRRVVRPGLHIQHAQQRMKQVVMADRGCDTGTQARLIDVEAAAKPGRQPHHQRHTRLNLRGNCVRHAVQVQATFAERLAVIRHIQHGSVVALV
jgi:signal transduction histidine kinase